MFVRAEDFKGYEKTRIPVLDHRRRDRERVTYYANKTVKSVYLNELTEVKTRYGNIGAEFLTFYESGSLKRLFPRYGAITAYWTEKDEELITDEILINVGAGKFICRPQCLHFYESGALQSITIYACDSLLISTEYGPIKTNIGVSFYENGKIQSIEPAFNSNIVVEGKIIRPFVFSANGMHADHNSLVFDDEGKIIEYGGKYGC